MHKKLFLIPLLILSTGCTNSGNTSSLSTSESTSTTSSSYTHNLKIAAPVGAPAIAFYDYAEDENFETNSDASNIAKMMVNKSVDVAVLPTNAGIKAIVGKKLDYKIAATISFGNLYIASTGNDNDETMDENDYIVLFQQGSVPDLVFHSIYGSSLDKGIHYVGKESLAAQCLSAGKDLTSENETVDYVLIAEPAFSTVKAAKSNVQEYANMQTLYREKFSYEIFQASIFVKNDADKSSVDLFLSSLESDISSGLVNPTLIKEGISKAKEPKSIFGADPETAMNVTKNGNRMGLGFKLAKDNKAAIDKFLSIFEINETSEEIYYK